MNLVSCDNCGVVLDKGKLAFPSNIWAEDGVDTEKGAWDGETWVAKVVCPVCGDNVLESA